MSTAQMKMHNNSSPKHSHRLQVILFNKHAQYVCHYTGVTALRFQGDATIHRYFRQVSLVTVVATLWEYRTC